MEWQHSISTVILHLHNVACQEVYLKNKLYSASEGCLWTVRNKKAPGERRAPRVNRVSKVNIEAISPLPCIGTCLGGALSRVTILAEWLC